MTDNKSLYFRNYLLIFFCAIIFCMSGCTDNDSSAEVLPDETDFLTHTEPITVAFFGDSITARGSFENYFEEATVLNFGLDGDTILGAAERVKYVTDAEPDKIFLLIGINSLDDDNADYCLEEYGTLLSELAKSNKGADIYIQSVLPVSANMEHSNCSNTTIRLFNTGIEQLAAEYGFTYIDLYPAFAENGMMKKELTVDGLHLSDAGYEIWADIIRKYIE